MDRKFTLHRNEADARDLKYRSLARTTTAPSSLDLRASGNVPRALNQGDLGSCVSNAVSNALRFAMKQRRVANFQPSRLQNYYDARVKVSGWPAAKDTGLTMRSGCQAAVAHGVCPEMLCPYTISRFSAPPNIRATSEALKRRSFRYYAVGQTLPELKRVLADGNIVMCGILVFRGFLVAAGTGVVPMPDASERHLGGHAQTLVGYSDSKGAFLSLNSWGPEFGEDGCSWIPYAYVLNPALAGDFTVIVATG